jgi:hypothetical protein
MDVDEEVRQPGLSAIELIERIVGVEEAASCFLRFQQPVQHVVGKLLIARQRMAIVSAQARVDFAQLIQERQHGGGDLEITMHAEPLDLWRSKIQAAKECL